MILNLQTMRKIASLNHLCLLFSVHSDLVFWTSAELLSMNSVQRSSHRLLH